MNKCWILAALGVVISGGALIGCSRSEAQASASQPVVKSERNVQLLVYTSNFGMVQETRPITLAAGVSRIGLTEVSKQLDQSSVIFTWPDRKDASVRSSTYDLGTAESSKLLERFLGKEVELVFRSDTGREGDRVRGTLEVAESGNVVVKSGGKYLVNPDAMIEAPADQGIVTIPQLSAEVDSKSSGPANLGVSYLTEGISWHADYTLTLPSGSATTGDLEAWASVTNQTGTDYPDATLKFVAGAPNRAAVSTLDGESKAKAPALYGLNERRMRGAMGGAAGFSGEPEAMGELYAYPYEAKATIRQDQINRVRMMQADGMTVKRWYAIALPYAGRDGFGANPEQRIKATMGLNFKNNEASKLGQPLPAGGVRVFEPGANGQPQYIGAATIGDTPKDADVSLTLTNVFDIYAQGKVVKSEKVGKRKLRKSFEITVHNEKKADSEVRLTQSLYEPYVVEGETVKSVKLNGYLRQWTVHVPAGGTTVLKVTMLFSY